MDVIGSNWSEEDISKLDSILGVELDDNVEAVVVQYSNEAPLAVGSSDVVPESVRADN